MGYNRSTALYWYRHKSPIKQTWRLLSICRFAHCSWTLTTLFDFQTSSRNALHRVPRLRPAVHAGDGSATALRTAELWQRFERGGSQRFVERPRLFFAEYGLRPIPAAFNAAYFQGELGDQCNFMPHCERRCGSCTQQYKIFIVTNGNTEIQMCRIAASGMAQYF